MLPHKSKTPRRDPELRRLAKLVHFEEEARSEGFSSIAGVDEAGRGPLAGPVYASACIIPQGIYFRGIDDSKRLTADERVDIYNQIVSHPDIVYAIAFSTHEEIDRVNIFQATILAMLKAVAALQHAPDCILVDGLKLPHPTIATKKIIGGDALSQSIAAASILAKVTRDRVMEAYHQQWPQYGFERHKGYATPEHINAINTHGPSPIHRMTYEPIKSKFKKPQWTELELFS